MEVTRYSSIPAFYEEVESFLLDQEDRAAIILGSCRRLRDQEWGEEKPFLATVKQNSKIMLAAMLIPPNAMLLLEKEEADGIAAVRYLAEYLVKEDYAIHKIMSPKAVGKAFAEQYAKVNVLEGKVLVDLRLYTLKEVIQPVSLPGKLRLARVEDMSFLPDWIRRMTEETKQIITKAEAVEVAKARLESGFLFIWEEDGRAVSMASKARPNIKGVSVNLVYTPKEWRGRGYASACVAALSEHLLSEGYEFCTLYTDLSNPTSNKIYQNIGYVPVCDYIELKFNQKIAEEPA